MRNKMKSKPFNYVEHLLSLTDKELIKEQKNLETLIDRVGCFGANDIRCLLRVYEEIAKRNKAKSVKTDVSV